MERRLYVRNARQIGVRANERVYFVAFANQGARDVRTDETRGAGEQDFHSREPYWAA